MIMPDSAKVLVFAITLKRFVFGPGLMMWHAGRNIAPITISRIPPIRATLSIGSAR
jgi:hypothetical protein